MIEYIKAIVAVKVSHGVVQTEEEVAAAVVEADLFALASHQYWGVWALIQVGVLGSTCMCLVLLCHVHLSAIRHDVFLLSVLPGTHLTFRWPVQFKISPFSSR